MNGRTVRQKNLLCNKTIDTCDPVNVPCLMACLLRLFVNESALYVSINLLSTSQSAAYATALEVTTNKEVICKEITPGQLQKSLLPSCTRT